MKNHCLHSRFIPLLALLLALLCLPLRSALAATTATKEAYAVLSTDNKTLTFYYDTYKSSRVGTIYTSSNFRTSESNGWGGSASTITTVTFNSSFADYTSLTSTAQWFRDMVNLTTINGLTYLYTGNVTNMKCMFTNCKNLTSLNVSGFNTVKVTDMAWLFHSCENLTSLDVSSFNTANVTDMWGMFYECKKLASLNVSNFNTANVQYMSFMFTRCSSLTSLNVSNFNTSNVTDMYCMFGGCSGLTSLDLGNFDTRKVTTMGWMFNQCNNLTSLNISNFYTSNVTNMAAMFCRCNKLSSLDLRSFNTAKVTTMSGPSETLYHKPRLDSSNRAADNTLYGMFENCSSLTTIQVGSSWTVANVTASTDMFEGCTKLVGGDGTVYNSSYTDKTKAYAGTGGYLTKTNEAYAVVSTDGSTLTFYYDTYRASRAGTKYTSSNFRTNSSNGWGGSASTITTVTFNSSFSNYTSLTSTAYWFHGMENLTAINGLSYLKTNNVTTMRNMFYNCKNLTSLNLSGFNTAKVTVMWNMFYNCQNLTSLDLSSFNTANVNDMDNLFYNCSKLVTIRVSSLWTTASVTYSSSMFYNCTKLVGGDGTVYNSNYTDKTKAYAGIGGYLTMEGQAGAREAYAVLSTDGTTLTFYYDANKSSRPGTIYTSNNFRTSQSNGWGGSKSTITTVTFNSSFANYTSLTSTAYWFDGMENLTTINGLSYLKTNNVTTMRNMFYNCKNLTSLNLSGFNTAKVTVMWNMFYNCQNLTSLDLSSFNTANVNDMDNLFYNCSKLVTIRVSSLWTTASVTYSSSMFYNCTSLVGGDGTVYDPNYTDKTKAYAGIGGYLTMEGQAGAREAYAVLSTDGTTLTFYYDGNKSSRVGTIYTSSNFRTSTSSGWGGSQSTITTVTFDSSFADYTSLTSTAYWFYGMRILTTINGLSYLKTENVTSMSCMFRFCISLTSLNVSSFNTAKVTNMNGMFHNCQSLTSLNLSNFSTANVTDMGYMFYGCAGLTSLDVSSFNTAKVTSMSYMFYYCESLTSLNLSNFSTANVTNMRSMFDGCKGLTSLNVSSFNTAKVTSMISMFQHCESVTSLNVSNFSTANVTDMGYMFNCCKSLTSLNVSSFNTAKVTKMSALFEYCESLTSLNLSNFITANVTDMNFMFGGCKNLNSLNLSNFSTASVMDMGNMFYLCKNLTNLNVSSFNTAKVTSMYEMFYSCESLTSLNLSNFITENVTSMGNMFYGCKGLTSLDVSSFNTANVTNLGGMFYNCSNLTNLDLSSFNTEKVTNMSYSNYYGIFRNCSNLATIYVSDQWATDNAIYVSNMFKDCTSLVGGDGTVYDPNYIDKTKAYAGRGGYLTLKVDDDLQYYLNSLTDSEDSFEDGVYTRQFTNWDWQTLYVPFSMSYSNWQARFEVASIGWVTWDSEGTYMNASIMGPNSTVQPNTPYLIRAKVKAKSKLYVRPSTVVDQEENVHVLENAFWDVPKVAYIKGVYTTQPDWLRPDTGADFYDYRMRGGALTMPESTEEVLPPYRWYLKLMSQLQPNQVRVCIVDEEATSIAKLRTAKPEAATDGTAYDLLGRKVRTDADGKAPLRKGLYIINNKKRVVK